MLSPSLWCKQLVKTLWKTKFRTVSFKDGLEKDISLLVLLLPIIKTNMLFFWGGVALLMEERLSYRLDSPNNLAVF